MQQQFPATRVRALLGVIGLCMLTACDPADGDLDLPGVVEDLRIGSASQPGPQLFDAITDVAVGTDGRILVANDGTGQVRVFDSTGTFLYEFGRRGQGPGEFTMLNDIWPLGDTTVVIDWQTGGRTSVFSGTGEHIASWANTSAEGVRHLVVARVADGWLAAISEVPKPPFPQGEPIRFLGRFVVLDPNTREQSRDGWLRESSARLFASAASGGLDWPLFEPRGTEVITPHGLQFVVPDPLQYRIEVRDADFKLLRTIEHEFEPRPVGERDVQELRDMIKRHYELQPAMPGWTSLDGALSRINDRANLPLVSTQSPFGRVLGAEDGELWVERPDLTRSAARVEYESMYSPAARMSELEELPTAWDRFDSTGTYVGSIQLPARFTASALWKGRVYGVLLGDANVEYVVRYRVEQ